MIWTREARPFTPLDLPQSLKAWPIGLCFVRQLECEASVALCTVLSSCNVRTHITCIRSNPCFSLPAALNNWTYRLSWSFMASGGTSLLPCNKFTVGCLIRALPSTRTLWFPASFYLMVQFDCVDGSFSLYRYCGRNGGLYNSSLPCFERLPSARVYIFQRQYDYFTSLGGPRLSLMHRSHRSTWTTPPHPSPPSQSTLLTFRSEAYTWPHHSRRCNKLTSSDWSSSSSRWSWNSGSCCCCCFSTHRRTRKWMRKSSRGGSSGCPDL